MPNDTAVGALSMISEWVERMGRQKISVAVLGSVFLLGGCSFVNDGLWPTLTGDEPSGQASERIVVGPSPSEQQLQPTLSPPPSTVPQYSGSLAATSYAAQPIGATGTFVGAKVSQHANELWQLAAQKWLPAREAHLADA